MNTWLAEAGSRPWFRWILRVVLSGLALPNGLAAQPSVEVLHAFGLAPRRPAGGVIQASDGHLYGTTHEGGYFAGGGVYRLERNSSGWEITLLHEFSGPDGRFPYAGLIEGSDGNFYGTTRRGGDADRGTVFRVTPDGGLATLHSFHGPDGDTPLGALVQAGDGNFYGTTLLGGVNDRGTIFKMTPGGAVTRAHSFAFVNGAHPVAGLTRGVGGTLYGTTFYGGLSTSPSSLGFGTVFRLSPTGVHTTLYRFTPTGAGIRPAGRLVYGRDGNLYGTAYEGGRPADGDRGAVFRITPLGEFTMLHAFTGAKGAHPAAGLVQGIDGTFYAPTMGHSSPGGTFYSMRADGAVTKLRSFATDGIGHPLAALIEGVDGLFYGTSNSFWLGLDVTGYVPGSVYSVSPDGDLSIVHRFFPNPDFPNSLIRSSGGSFYITTRGTILELGPSGTTRHVRSVPGRPSRLLEGRDGDLYGTEPGGASSAGTAFRVSPTGDYEILHAFGGGDDGSTPKAGLIQTANGDFHGTTVAGGENGRGTVFRMTESGAVTIVHAFAGTDGDGPEAALVEAANGDLYGTTASGGAADLGTVFKVSPSGAFTSLHSFSGDDGATPSNRLVPGNDGHFYGIAGGGLPAPGPNPTVQMGTVFKIAPDGEFTMLYAFTGEEDSAFPSSFVLGGDGMFYGTTTGFIIGGFQGLFRMTPDGSLTNIHAFDYNREGGWPQDLLWGPDGALYGTNQRGGPGSADGTIFRLIP